MRSTRDSPASSCSWTPPTCPPVAAAALPTAWCPVGLVLALGLGQGLWRADPPPGELPGGLVVLVVVLTPQLLPVWGPEDWGARCRAAVPVTVVVAREDGERG